MRILKRIFELVFIFILPLVFCFCSFKKEIVNTYDENNNLLTSENNYNWDFPFNDFKSSYHYINYLKLNQLFSNDSVTDVSKIHTYGIFVYGNINQYKQLSNFFTQINGHKYYINIKLNPDTSTNQGQIYFYATSSGTSRVSLGNNTTSYENIVSVTNADEPYKIGLYASTSAFFNCEIYYNIIDLTIMFGSGYEPSSINELNNYINLSTYIDYTLNENIVYYSENVNISSEWVYNYTFWGKLFNELLIDTLKFNDVFVVRFASSYIVLVIFMVFAYHMLIWPLDLLFRILFFKERL